MARFVSVPILAVCALGCGDSREITTEEALAALRDVHTEGLLNLAMPAGQALREDDTLTSAAGEDWSFSFAPGSTQDQFSGTLVVTHRVLDEDTTAEGVVEWHAFDGEVEHSTIWLQGTPTEPAYSRHVSTGMLKVTDQDGRWFRVHRLVVGTFRDGGICHRADVEGSDGVLVDPDFETCPPR